MKIQHRLLTFIALFFFGFTTASCQDNRLDVAQDLLDSFSSSCHANSSWTQIALQQTNALQSNLERLLRRSEGPCAQQKLLLEELAGLNTQVIGLLADENFAGYREAEETVQELTLALTQSDLGSDLAEKIGNNLASTRQ